MTTEIFNTVTQRKCIKCEIRFCIIVSTKTLNKLLETHVLFLEEHEQHRFGTNGVLTETVMPPEEQRQEMAEFGAY